MSNNRREQRFWLCVVLVSFGLGCAMMTARAWSQTPSSGEGVSVIGQRAEYQDARQSPKRKKSAPPANLAAVPNHDFISFDQDKSGEIGLGGSTGSTRF